MQVRVSALDRGLIIDPGRPRRVEHSRTRTLASE
jgi:hypothetical protein